MISQKLAVWFLTKNSWYVPDPAFASRRFSLGLFLSHNAFDNVCASLVRVWVDEQCPCAPPAYTHPSIPILNTHTHRIKRTHIKRKHAADVRLVMCDMYEIAQAGKGCWGTECWSNLKVSKSYSRASLDSKKVEQSLQSVFWKQEYCPRHLLRSS